MKVNIRKHKKKLTALVILGAVVAISIPLMMPKQPAEDIVREREYTVTRDTITVGVESSGVVDTAPNAHTFESGTVVEELLVKVGSEVKKGQAIASISMDNLNEQIEAAKSELSDAKAALLQASSAKDVLLAQNNQDKQTALTGVQQEYAGRTELLTNEKSRIETSIAQQEQTLSQLEQQITDMASQASSLQEKSQQLQAKIDQNILEIGRLNEELLQQEESSEQANTIQLKITQLQNENTAMQQEIDTYMADPVLTEVERLKEEQKNCENSLNNSYEELALKAEEIQRTEKQLQQALENQNQKNSFLDYKTNEDLKALNENITKANQNLQAAQEKVSHLQELAKQSTMYAQLDGIVTALNYKVGDTIVDGKPLCIVGELDQTTMTVPVSAADIGNVSVGQKVNIYVDAYAEQKFTGVVKERLLVANDNGEYPVTISIDPGEQTLLPGMKAYATIILKEKVDVLTLSNKAITLENGKQHVLVRNEAGELIQKQIVTGFSDGRVSEILDGLTENEIVIVQE